MFFSGCTISDLSSVKLRRVSRLGRPLHAGSSWPVQAWLEGSDCIFLKLRGSGDGFAGLWAEWLGSRIAERAGFPVISPFWVWLPQEAVPDYPDPEFLFLKNNSTGLNLGFPWKQVQPGNFTDLGPGWAERIFLLDLLLANPDRSPSNPNLLIEGGNIRISDFGSAALLRAGLTGQSLPGTLQVWRWKLHPGFTGSGLMDYFPEFRRSITKALLFRHAPSKEQVSVLSGKILTETLDHLSKRLNSLPDLISEITSTEIPDLPESRTVRDQFLREIGYYS